jgi:predicted signal transduction protein with EAL and GGDEF domain
MRSEGQTNKDVTASFGIASISPQFGSSHDSIIAMANDALHEAIKSGANQVKLYCGSDMAIEGVENESNSQAEENIYRIASLVAFAAFVAAILWVFISE